MCRSRNLASPPDPQVHQEGQKDFLVILFSIKCWFFFFFFSISGICMSPVESWQQRNDMEMRRQTDGKPLEPGMLWIMELRFIFQLFSEAWRGKSTHSLCVVPIPMVESCLLSDYGLAVILIIDTSSLWLLKWEYQMVFQYFFGSYFTFRKRPIFSDNDTHKVITHVWSRI